LRERPAIVVAIAARDARAEPHRVTPCIRKPSTSEDLRRNYRVREPAKIVRDARLGASLILPALSRQTGATFALFGRRLLAPCRALVRSKRRNRTRLGSTGLIAKAVFPGRRLKAIAGAASLRLSVTSSQTTRMMPSTRRLCRFSARYGSLAACHQGHRDRRGLFRASEHVSSRQIMAHA
jgi:hypothetical protein